MKFLLDENFPKAAITSLEDLGHTCFDVRGTELEGKADRLLMEDAQRRGAIILTTDRDFFHTLRHKCPDHPGVIVIALRKPHREAILERLAWLLSTVMEHHFPGRAFQLRDRTWVARPPIPD